jgi:hypothetical protein
MPATPWVTVYTGATADTAVLRDLLEAVGIPARLGDEVMGTLAPYVIAGGTTAAIKVLVPQDKLDAAREIVVDFTEREEDTPAPSSDSFQPWECPCCHEQNDGSFDICWNCQTQKA